MYYHKTMDNINIVSAIDIGVVCNVKNGLDGGKCVICGIESSEDWLYCDDHGDIDNPIDVLCMIVVCGDSCYNGFTPNSVSVVGIDTLTKEEVDFTDDNTPHLGYEPGEGWSKYPIYKFKFNNNRIVSNFGNECVSIYIPRSNVQTSFRELDENINKLFEWKFDDVEKFYVMPDPNDLFHEYKIEKLEDFINIQRLIPGIDKYIKFLNKDVDF
jgi:hypothetical protein